ncbi:double zinc ribbon domain-containing protein, partial [bacterium]|nr:double zinc ribbon domain-containing protein [bacterium]
MEDVRLHPPSPRPSPRSRARDSLARHLSAAVSWVLPALCPRCGAPSTRPAHQFCAACWAALRPLRPEDAGWTV